MHELPVECSHDLCNCSVTGSVAGGDAFCSSDCEDATQQSIESETCACGHPACDVP
jgi:hypothetical protein